MAHAELTDAGEMEKWFNRRIAPAINRMIDNPQHSEPPSRTIPKFSAAWALQIAGRRFESGACNGPEPAIAKMRSSFWRIFAAA